MQEVRRDFVERRSAVDELDLQAALAQQLDAAAAMARIRIQGPDVHATDAASGNRIHTGRGLAMRGARLQRDHQRVRGRCAGSGGAQGFDLGVRPAEPTVHATADHLSASEQGGPHARVRRDLKALQAGFFA